MVAAIAQAGLVSVAARLHARRGELPPGDSATTYFTRAELLDAAGWTANDVERAAVKLGASSFAEAVLLEGVRLEQKQADAIRLAQLPDLLAKVTAAHNARSRMDLLFAAGKVPEREYFAWLRDHAGDASFAIDDEELCALFDVEPEELHAWRTDAVG